MSEKFDLSNLLENTPLENIGFSTSLPSTNDRAIELAKAEPLVATPTLVLTEIQTQGRGQKSRDWQASSGSLTCSLILDGSQMPAQVSGGLPANIAVAVCEAIEFTSGLSNVQIKWPNDIIIEGRKAGGILIESVIKPGNVPRRYVVIGIGLNVNNPIKRNQVRPDAIMAPVSIMESSDKRVDLTELLMKLLNFVFERLSDSSTTTDTYNLRSHVNGKQVTIQLPDSTLVTGTAKGITDCGELRVFSGKDGSGNIRSINSGTIKEINSLN